MTMAEYSSLLVAADGGIATITVNRPEKLNALNHQTIAELDLAMDTLEGDESVRGIIITGSGPKAFVAGADIGELARMSPVEGVEVSRHGQRVFRRIELCRKPVVAAVNGFALGGGCELALACHLRVASRTASFGFPEVGLGILPGYGGTVRLPRLVGLGRALELLLTGARIDAEEAYRIGIANRLSEADSLLADTRDLLGRILANAPIAVGFTIESATRGVETGIDDGTALESHLFGLLSSTEDMREGMAAFLEKRKPEFRGR
jgi:enoyl-CoA hydratase